MNSYIFFFASFIDTVLERLFDIIGSVFNILWARLCSIVYGLIVLAFNLFTEVSQLDILSADKVNGIYQRLTMIITIVMVFYITFEFIKYVISPDTISDKEKGAGKVVARIVTAILLIAFVPTIFSWGYKIQQRILDTNVIPVVILGQKNWNFKSAGSNFAGNVFSAFYRANCDSETTEKECNDAREKVDKNIAKFKEDKGLLALEGALAEDIISSLKSIVTGKKLIQFDGLLALVFGCFTLYVLFSYVLDLGTRYIQLLFLQIIAPVAIISSITPQKDSMLKKWAKQCSTTYLDVFIRLAILYFMMLIVSILSSSLDFYEMTKNGEQINVFVYIVVIAGLLIFVQRAPKLLKELFPQGGAASLGFGFSAKSRLEPLGKTISSMVKPVAAGVGLATGARSIFKKGVGADGKKHLGLNKDLISEKDKKGNKFKDRLKRGATYAVSAAKAGFKGASTGAKTGRFKDAQVSAQQSTQGDEARVNAGGSVLGATFRGAYYQNVKTDLKTEVEDLQAITKAKDSVSSSVKDMKVMKTMESYKNDWYNRGIGDASAREKVMKDMEKAARVYAVSERSEADQAAFRQKMEEAIRTVYRVGTGPLNKEQTEIVNNLIASGEFDNVKWDTVKSNIEEAQRISEGRQVTVEQTRLDASGKSVTEKTVKTIDANNSGKPGVATIKEFAEKIGDVADEATRDITEINNSDEKRAADANAAEGKK